MCALFHVYLLIAVTNNFTKLHTTFEFPVITGYCINIMSGLDNANNVTSYFGKPKCFVQNVMFSMNYRLRIFSMNYRLCVSHIKFSMNYRLYVSQIMFSMNYRLRVSHIMYQCLLLYLFTE